MRYFDLLVESRMVGSIGRFERYVVRVSAENEDAAQESVRTREYAAGREHVHVLKIGEVFNPIAASEP